MSSGILATPVTDHFMNLAQTIGILTDPFISPIESVAKITLNSTFPGVFQYFADVLEEHKSPFVDRLPLMNPFHVLLITIGYLTTIFLGKQFMSQRQKASVKELSALHNFLMVSLSGYMCITIWTEAWRNGYTLFANPEDRSEKGYQMAKYTWLFYFSKIFEFMDTFIMILKKNNHQISFLHVYHHSSVFVIWWWVIYVSPTGETYFSAALNSVVHVVMYGYYLSTTLSFPIRFIKRYITLMQMTQFIMNMIQATYDILHFKFLFPTLKETYPFNLTILLWVYMWTMLGLFANFFVLDRKREREARKKNVVEGKRKDQ